MRLWSLHPKYLDPTGLTACWREGLLARKVLRGETSGYRSHPQLERFRAFEEPLTAIEYYLKEIFQEASRRGYRFDPGKIDHMTPAVILTVCSGQLKYEFGHLMKKLKIRSPEYALRWGHTYTIEPHPMFRVITGEIESWEKL